MGPADSILIPNEIRRMSGESISRPAIATTISNVLFSKDWREEIDRRTIRGSERYLLVCNITQPRCNELIDLDGSKSQPLATRRVSQNRVVGVLYRALFQIAGHSNVVVRCK